MDDPADEWGDGAPPARNQRHADRERHQPDRRPQQAPRGYGEGSRKQGSNQHSRNDWNDRKNPTFTDRRVSCVCSIIP